MLHFNQRNWFKFLDETNEENETLPTLPEPSTAKEYYLAKIAGVYDGDLPDPKTPTEFYLAKMAGVEVGSHLEKVFEQEFTFPAKANGRDSEYIVTISNAYDEAVDANNLIVHIDGNNDDPSIINVSRVDDGTVNIKTTDASYAGTTHTLELFYKSIIEDVPVKTRTEKYLKAIAANQDSSDSSVSKG